MTKPIGIISMQEAINVAKNILCGFTNSTKFFHGGREDDPYYRMTLVDEAIQGTEAYVEANSGEVLHVIPHPAVVPPPADPPQ
ncbi:hypothetical protein [uncultured Nitrospira sp.]|uniref:hypothetical protein n=1 Tax=uncultured Nitrospira sp. TaxID=157176 RepID=UPI0031407FA6